MSAQRRTSEIFTNASAVFTNHVWEIITYRKLAKVGLSAVGGVAQREGAALAADFLKRIDNAVGVADPSDDDPIFATSFEEAIRANLSRPQEGDLAQGIGNLLSVITHQVLDRSCIIFLHAVLESGIMGLLEAVAAECPEAFADRVANRQIAFDTMRTTTSDTILKSLIVKYLADVEKESLMKKVDALCAACPEWKPANRTAKLDKPRLERFNELRHSIVHRLESVPSGFSVDDELVFIMLTFAYLTAMVADVYGLRFDGPSMVRTFMGKTTG